MSSGDGRNIDPALGALEGEAAQQRASGSEGTAAFEVWTGPGARDPGTTTTYFDRPLLKQPVWIWSVPAYFYVGGTAGAAATLGLTAQIVDRKGLADLVARCRWITTAGVALGSVLLIIDLGRPERFANMLRVFRPTSVLNMGSWVLALTGPSAGLAALTARSAGFAGRVGDVGGAVAGLLGLPLSGYTAVLLADTAVPVWASMSRSLPWLFVASSADGAASVLEQTATSPHEKKIVSLFGTAARVAHLAGARAVAADAGRNERIGRSLTTGPAGSLWRASKAAAAAGLVASVAIKNPRWRAIIGGSLGAAASLSLRFAVFHAGKASAADSAAGAGRSVADRTKDQSEIA